MRFVLVAPSTSLFLFSICINLVSEQVPSLGLLFVCLFGYLELFINMAARGGRGGRGNYGRRGRYAMVEMFEGLQEQIQNLTQMVM